MHVRYSSVSVTGVERDMQAVDARNRKRYSSGISLIEMLIALLVLSFGLLGIAGLQAYSLRNNSNAYYRSVANSLAYDIVDRMRANRAVAQAAGTNYNIALATNKPASLTDVRLQDQAEWLAATGDASDPNAPPGMLPLGDGAINCTTNLTPVICQVTVQWDDSRGVGAVQQFVLSTEL